MAQKQRYYEIESQSAYAMKVKEIKNIEDAVDEFFTEEEMKEQLGVHWCCFHNGVTIKQKRVEELLKALKATMQKNNKRSIIIEDDDFVSACKEHDMQMSAYVDGLRRVGNRLFLHEKKARVGANKNDMAGLINIGIAVVNKQYGIPKKEHSEYPTVHMEFKYTHENYAGVVNILKKLTTIEDIITHHLPYLNDDVKEQRCANLRQCWETPNMFDKKRS